MQKNLKEDYFNWFKEYDWCWIATLTLRDGDWQTVAVRRFRSWLRCLQSNEPNPLSWVRVGEYGRENSRYHFHVLIAGIAKTSIDLATRRWELLAGMARVDRYDRKRNGLLYILKQCVRNADPDIDQHLEPGHWLPQIELVAHGTADEIRVSDGRIAAQPHSEFLKSSTKNAPSLKPRRITLKRIAWRLRGVPTGNGEYIGVCPAHRGIGLIIRSNLIGQIVLDCAQGCELRDIQDALGLNQAGVFVDANIPRRELRRRARKALAIRNASGVHFPNASDPMHGPNERVEC